MGRGLRSLLMNLGPGHVVLYSVRRSGALGMNVGVFVSEVGDRVVDVKLKGARTNARFWQSTPPIDNLLALPTYVLRRRRAGAPQTYWPV